MRRIEKGHAAIRREDQRPRCDRCQRVLPPERRPPVGIVYPLHLAVWHAVHPDPADQRRVLSTCSDACSWQLGIDLAAALTTKVRAARRHRGGRHG